MRRAAELMPARLVTVRADEPLLACAALFRGYDIRHLPVVDAEGALVGVVHEEDVASHGVSMGTDAWSPVSADEPLARGLARPCPVHFHPDDPVEDVIRRMLSERADVAVALADGRVVGLITEHDAVWAAQWSLGEERTAGEAASRPVAMMPSSTTVADAHAEMVAGRIRHLLVTDDGEPTGVVSIRDLVAAGGARERFTRLSAVARSPFLTIDEGQPLACAATRMAESKVGCLPVVDADGRVVGILTRTDLARFLSA